MEITNQLKQFIDHSKNKMTVGGCQIGQKLFLSGCLKEFFVYITNSSEKLMEMKTQLQTLSRKPQVMQFVDYPLTYSLFNDSQKYNTLANVVNKECDCLLIDVRCLQQKYPAKEKYLSNSISIKVGDNLERESLNLEMLGYQRVSKVEKMGQYAIRGDILDIYATSVSARISFFDTEVESIKLMNFEDNISINTANQISISPNTFIFKSDIDLINQKINSLQSANTPDAIASFESIKSMITEELNNLSQINRLEFLNGFVNNNSIFDYLNNYVIIVDEPQMVLDSLQNHIDNQNKQIKELIDGGQLYLTYNENFFDFNSIKQQIDNSNSIIFDNFTSKCDIVFDCSTTQNYKNRTELLIYDIKSLLEKDYSISIFTNSEIDKNFLAEILNKQLIKFDVVNDIDKSFKKGVKIVNKTLPFGCILNGEKIALLAYGNNKTAKSSKTSVEKPFFELPQEGDYVVHDFHGIGLCMGIQKMKISGFVRDYIVIKYDGSDKLYLPVENADSITKYIGQENPKLNKIGGAEFEKAKRRVREQLEVMATDMLKIYAEREKSYGHQYEVDTFVQKQFEESFAYDETPDQLKAIADIKADMRSKKIMDRLICGDVGYGKTEVAFRACMIAIDNNKQVVLLAPTTILSEQHFKSAKSRFEGFGVRIAVLNRFKTTKEQNEILEKLKNGEIDLLIGTQKVLSDKIQFHDLGLLICDEEQKLGVKDKEKIKKLKHNIDVLSMSATPIPRTLHMSLVGIRDISTIATAPKLRKSVQTTICEYSSSLVKTVIERELERNGQVLIVKNRVEGLEEYVFKLKNLLPNARIAYAHGQMDKDKLENTMKDVFDCKIDILVATTLIENGIDLPNANTMIVLNADKFGLSAVYQLRGRVGRSSEQAYAYFTFDDFKSLSEEGAKRLQAMQEYTDLGSGFKIAMRDLEIRGAGTVLGEKQSGHLEKVGYDMYCKLLEQVIAMLKGKEEMQAVELKVDVDIQAEIPNYYISDSQIKMEVIDRISKIENKDMLKVELQKLSNEFGALPKQVVNLAKLATLKNIFKNLQAKSIIFKINGKNQIEFINKPALPTKIAKMGELVEQNGSFLFKLPTKSEFSQQIDELINNS